MPGWVANVIWWQVYPLGFTGAPAVRDESVASQGDSRLPQLLNWLDYAVELGASGLALGPVFSSETHGYDTVDYFRIDERLGTDADFDALVEACRSRGLRVLLDGVFNHVGRSHPAFQQALRDGPDGATASWFDLEWATDWQPGGPAPSAGNFEGHDQLVRLNHREPAVADLVVQVMNFWLDRGADGWRLDAAYAVAPEFWSAVLPRVRATHPEAYIVGEVIHGDYPKIVAESGLDSVTQYELWKAIWSSLNELNLYELAWAMKRHNEFLEAFVPLTFVGNHDVTRLASRLAQERHLPHALVVLFTLGGTPSVYYGDEQAFRGVKEERFGGDDAIRPAFPASPPELAPEGWQIYRLHQELIGLRRRHSWLHTARSTQLALTNTSFVYESVSDGRRIVVVLNIGTEPLSVSVPNVRTVLAGAADLGDPAGSERAVAVDGFGWVVLAG